MTECHHDGPVYHKFDSGNCPLLCKRCNKIIGWWSLTKMGYEHHFENMTINVPALHLKDDIHGYALYATKEAGIVKVFETIKEVLDYVHDIGRPGVDVMVEWPDSFSYDPTAEDDEEEDEEW